jgi:hypothetical protein
MKTLSELKAALTALPDKRRRAKAGSQFSAYLAHLKTARQRIALVTAAAGQIKEFVPFVNPEPQLAGALKAARQAAQLRDTLVKQPENIADSQTQRALDLLQKAAETAANGLRDTWTRGLEAKVKEKGAIVKLLTEVMPVQGRQLKKVVASLQSETAPPTDKESAKRVRDLFGELDKVVAGLELDGPFGDFLRAAASSDGADPKTLLDPEVKKAFDKYGLWKSFRVRSSVIA